MANHDPQGARLLEKLEELHQGHPSVLSEENLPPEKNYYSPLSMAVILALLGLSALIVLAGLSYLLKEGFEVMMEGL